MLTTTENLSQPSSPPKRREYAEERARAAASARVLETLQAHQAAAANFANVATGIQAGFIRDRVFPMLSALQGAYERLRIIPPQDEEEV